MTMGITYNHDLRRWSARPHGVRWSEMVLGRMACHRTLAEWGEITVSCYDYQGVRRYTYPVTCPASKAGSGVLYRIRVRRRRKEV